VYKRQEGNISRTIWALAISALAVSLLGWYQKYFDMEFLNPVWSQQVEPRITSFFPYSNAVGLYLGPIVILLAAYIKNLVVSANKKKFIQALVLTIVAGMSLMSISFARSEGAMLGVLVGLFVIMLFSSARLARFSLAMAAITLALIISVPQARNFAWQKISLSDLSGEIRKQQWRETIQMLTSNQVNFLYGVGLSGFPEGVKPFHQEGIFFNSDNDPEFARHVRFNAEYRSKHWQPVNVYQYPHNIFLNFWSELGMLGVLLTIWLLIKYLYHAGLLFFKQNNFLALGLAAAMLVWLVHGLVDVPYFKNDLSLLWWLMFAMLGSLMLQYERSTTKNNSR